MDIDKIKLNDVLKNTKANFCGYVISVGTYIKLKNSKSIEMTFDAAYLVPASETEQLEFKKQIALESTKRDSSANSTSVASSIYPYTLTRQATERLFSPGDIIKSGGGDTEFFIVDFVPNGVKIKSTDITTKTVSILRYDKLAIITDNLKAVEKALQKDVQQRVIQHFLAKHDLTETFCEGYLLGFAREFKIREAKVQGKSL